MEHGVRRLSTPFHVRLHKTCCEERLEALSGIYTTMKWGVDQSQYKGPAKQS